MTKSVGCGCLSFCFPARETTLRRARPRMKTVLVLEDIDVHSEYDFNDSTFLGKGGFGTVFKAVDRVSHEDVAIKRLPRKIKHFDDYFGDHTYEDDADVENRFWDNDNIVKVFKVFCGVQDIHIVMELCDGGDLCRYIERRQDFFEDDCKGVMYGVLRAVNHIHTREVVHRDLKLENIMLSRAIPKGEFIQADDIKILDFGLAAKFETLGDQYGRSGTLAYMAPELLDPDQKPQFTPKADTWSCGVILFVLLFGRLPIVMEEDGESATQQMFTAIQAFKFPADTSHISAAASGLLKQLLTIDFERRVTAAEALGSLKADWFQDAARQGLHRPVPKHVLTGLIGLSSKCHLQQTVLHIIADQLHVTQSKELRDIFKQLDTDDDGFLSKEELEQGLCNLQRSLSSLSDNAEKKNANFQHELKEKLSDCTGGISLNEFLAATVAEVHFQQDCVLRNAFLKFDLDRDGTISKSELKKMLAGREVQAVASDLDAEVSSLMNKYTDSDEITYDQFLKMMGVERRNTHRIFQRGVSKVIMALRLSTKSDMSAGKSA